MNIPINIINWTAAFIPILFLLVAMTAFNWSASKAAPAGMLLAALTSVIFFRLPFPAILIHGAKGIWNALTILLVIWPAVMIYELTCQVNGFSSIQKGIKSLTQHELVQIMILGWVFPSFLQGITGFGVAVAVGAPLLMSIGVQPVWSVVIVLLCHCWGATFGTLALAWQALVEQSGIAGPSLGRAAMLAALFIWAFNFIGGFCLCWFYGRARALKEGWPLLLLISLIQGGGELLLAGKNSQIACFLPSCLALGAMLGFTRLPGFHRNWCLEASPIMRRKKKEDSDESGLTFHAAFLPYYVLTAVTVVCLLIPPVKALLGQFKIALSFPGTVTGYGYKTDPANFYSPLAPLSYAGSFLLFSFLTSRLYYMRIGIMKRKDLGAIWSRTVKKAVPSSVAIISFIIMSKIMSGSGQIYVLSQGAVNSLGKLYLICSPLLGTLGTFVTSSNMSSNILLGPFQMTAAQLLAIDPAVTLALQTAGGVMGDSFSPGSIILGTSTTGTNSQEGKILKIILPISLTCSVILGLTAYFFLS